MKHTLLMGFLAAAIVACQTGENPPKTEKDTDPNPATLVDPEPTTEKHRELYENGQVKMEGELVDGERHGLWRSYYPDGKKWSETTFNRGVKSGRTMTFYENGMMRYQGQYANNERVGVWHFYNDDGELEKTVDHEKDGLQEGAK